MMRRILFGVGLFVCLQIAQAEPDPRAFAMEKIQLWESSMGVAWLDIENLHGDVRVRASEDQNIFILAVVQKVGNLEQPIAIDVHRTDEQGLCIEVLATDRLQERLARASMPPVLNRADLVVLIPEHLPIIVRTADGLLEAKGRAAGVLAFSEMGAIFIRTKGLIHARSVSGEIDAWPRGPQPLTAHSLYSEKGRVHFHHTKP